MDSLENNRRKILLATVVGQLRFVSLEKRVRTRFDVKCAERLRKTYVRYRVIKKDV